MAGSEHRLVDVLAGGLIGAVLTALIGIWAVEPVRASVCRDSHVSFGCDDKYQTVSLQSARTFLSTYLARAVGSGDSEDAWVMLDTNWQAQQDHDKWAKNWLTMFFAEPAGDVTRADGYNKFAVQIRVYEKGQNRVTPFDGRIYSYGEIVQLQREGSDLKIVEEEEQTHGTDPPEAHTYPRPTLADAATTYELPRQSSAARNFSRWLRPA